MKRKKIPLHFLMIRGSIGKQFVIKHYGKQVVITKFPDMSGIVASRKQRKCRNIFKEAVAYAKTIIADTIRKKEWQRRLRRRNGVYNAAIKEYMRNASRTAAKHAIEQQMKLVPIITIWVANIRALYRKFLSDMGKAMNVELQI